MLVVVGSGVVVGGSKWYGVCVPFMFCFPFAYYTAERNATTYAEQ